MLKRFSALFVSMCLVLTLLPAAVFAVGTNGGADSGPAKDSGQGGVTPYIMGTPAFVGAFTVTTLGVKDTDYSYDAQGHVLTVKTATPITIANTASGTPTTDTIVVDSAAGADITLNGVNIDVHTVATAAAMKITGTSGDVTVRLAGENTLISGANRAGLQKESTALLTITSAAGEKSGDGKLTAISGTLNSEHTASTNGWGAGIGGGYGDVTGGDGDNITIRGGTVTATSRRGAGIGGGGSQYGGNGDNITIHGGSVTATSTYGAGIGGGGASIGGGGGSNITISGGSVTATSTYGAGIGGGGSDGGNGGGNGDNITISGGSVTATSADGAGIGGGYGAGFGTSGGNGDNITISGGSVTATSNSSAGIGGGRSYSTGYEGTSTGFSTDDPDGAPGNAFLLASGGANMGAIQDVGGKDNWSGVIFEGDSGLVYGSPTLGTDAEIPAGKTLTVGTGKTLTIPAGITLQNNGIIINNGTIIGEKNIKGNPVNAIVHDMKDGPIYFQEANGALQYRIGNGAWITYTGTIILRGTMSSGSNGVQVWGGTHDITLNNVSITASQPVFIKSGAKVNLTLAAGSENTLTVNAAYPAGLGVPSGAELVIASASGNPGKLNANGGNGGAGIGGSANSGAGFGGGAITINGGVITATGNNGGAGIGGGAGFDSRSTGGSGGTVTIHGGSVTANGGKNGGAGIGGGAGGINSNMGGTGGSGGTVTIDGGSVTANGGSNGAGIGGGYAGSGGAITISGGDVTANGGKNGAGIGGGGSISGGGYSGGTVNISNGTVTANGGTGGAGIGGGENGAGGTVTISGGSVKAVGNGGGAGIGAGANSQDNGTLKNSSGADVALYTFTVGGTPVKNTLVTAFTPTPAYTYGLKDVKTDADGKLYFYLPQTPLTTFAAAAVGGENYTGAVANNAATLLLSVTYNLTVAGGTGSGSYAAGENVPITAAAPSGKQFDQWVLTSGGGSLANASSAATTYTMPANAATVTATYKDAPTPGHTHTWGTAWQSSATHHWHNCTAGSCPITENSQKDGYSAHVYDNDADDTCNTCGYIRKITPPTPSYSGGGRDSRTTFEKEVARLVSTLETARPGDRLTLDLRGGSKLPGDVLDALLGKDVTLTLTMGDGVSWVIRGTDLPVTGNSFGSLSLGVNTNANTIPVTVINSVTGAAKVMQLALSHNGAFDFTLTLLLNAGKENAGLWANLYYYNPQTKALEYRVSSLIRADGTAPLPFASASDYAVVIDKRNLGAPVFTDTANHWAKNSIDFATARGLMSGTTKTTFSPDAGVTRGVLAQAFTALSGKDMAALVGGDPAQALTRQELAVLMQSYAKAMNCTLPVAGDAAAFVGGAELNPTGTATRAELAAALHRFVNLVIDPATAPALEVKGSGKA